MPDVREIYEMVTQQAPPQPESLERQRKRQRRHTTNRRLGGFAVAAAIAVLAFLAIRVSGGDGGRQPATSKTDATTAAPSTTAAAGVAPPVRAPWVTSAATPEVDYVIDVNTGEMTPLPRAILNSLDRAVAYGRYAASPDGSTLAYVGLGHEGSAQIFVAGIDGSGGHQVTHDPIGATSPAWSPDGTRIVYEGHAGGHVSLFVLDVVTREATRVIDVTRGASPTFTPDGTKLLYTGGSSQQPVLRTVPVTGGKSRFLIGAGEGITDAGNGSMSPDGSLVTFLGSGFPASGEVEHCGPCRLVANADGTGRRVIAGWMATPAGTWSPDGSRIVAMDGGDGLPSVIVVVDVATEAATVVANGRAAIWLDDHTVLVEV